MGVIIHGLSKHPIYTVWRCMKNRCFNKSNHRYKDYGGRGISICKKWLIAKNFLNDMLPTYKKGLQLDRINNDGDYKPSNCRWVTPSQNQRNRRYNYMVKFKGSIIGLAECSELLNIGCNVLKYRHENNIPLDQPSNSHHILVTFRGRKRSLSEIARMLGLSKGAILNRYHKNMPIDKSPNRGKVMVLFKGHKVLLTELSKRLKIPYGVLHARSRFNISLDKPYKKRKSPEKYTKNRPRERTTANE